MLRTGCFATIMLLLPMAQARADTSADLGANAALAYWQAFATLPTFSDAEQNRLNNECLTMPLDERARDLVAKSEYALLMLRHGAARPNCDWGLGYEEGVFTRLPQGAATRALTALACLRARIFFKDGRPADAIDDVIAAMTLGRHISKNGTLIMVLVSYSIEHRMGQCLATYLPGLDAITLEVLKTRLDALPSIQNLAATVRTEEKWATDWFIRQVKEAKDQAALLAFLSRICDVGEGRNARENALVFLKQCGGSAESVLERVEETRKYYEVFARKLELPLAQFDEEYERESGAQAGNPAFKLLFPALDKCRRAEAKAEVRRALLSTALDIAIEGADAVKRHADPVAGGLFEYVTFDGGFELRSNAQLDEKPLVLSVGVRRK
jgi:hypothetical protein